MYKTAKSLYNDEVVIIWGKGVEHHENEYRAERTRSKPEVIQGFESWLATALHVAESLEKEEYAYASNFQIEWSW